MSIYLDPAPLYIEFLAELRARGFAGDLSSTHADRTVLATDNSIYQVTPQAIAFPRGTEDLVRIARLLDDPRFHGLKLAPRGGGTGTNGQSLTDGLVVDVSRHMNRILEIDAERRRVRVQAGVVKDQLNAALKPHGLFFAPELSTSNRATIGGMINTDACGQGSCLYGKTRDHVLALTTVLLDGTVWTSRPLDEQALAEVQARPDRVGAIHQLVDRIQRENAALIAERFPKLNRCLTGYDLAHIRDAQGRFDLNAILCGAEGTLGFIAEAELNVLPIPRHSALVNIRYDSFDAALRDARALMDVQAASIETVDSRVLALARKDIVWAEVSAFFPDDPEGPAEGVNLVEVLADDLDSLEAQIGRVTSKLEREGRANGRRGFTVARNEEGRATPGRASRKERAFAAGAQDNVRLAEDGDEAEGDGIRLAPAGAPAAVERIWGMRKKAVGLLGAMQGGRRPIPFVEDTAVPPEHLADYIAEFRAALDRRGLVYGMFGHVDAGVLHVRPAIDMTDPAQEPLIRAITDEVAALTQKYGGVLWGEHGKGVRSEYAPAFFGPLYPCLQQIKATFDPRHQLNPGKIAAPADGALLRIDEVPTRGARDRVVPVAIREAYDNALHCNGNGACYNWDPDDAMCPSWKGTRERRHSPKGRAQLMREWLRQLAALGLRSGRGEPASARRLGLAHAAGPHPQHLGPAPRRARLLARGQGGPGRVPGVQVLRRAMPDQGQRARFPLQVLRALLRPLSAPDAGLRGGRDRAPRALDGADAGRLERACGARAGAGAPAGGRARRPRRRCPASTSRPRSRSAASHWPRRRCCGRSRPRSARAAWSSCRTPSPPITKRRFSSILLDLIQALGFRPWLAPYRPNGKALHVHGFLGPFGRVAAANAAMLGELAATGVDLVGLDPSMTLTYRAEYAERAGEPAAARAARPGMARGASRRAARCRGPEYLLLPHCTERTTAPAALKDWQAAFAKVGLQLTILPSGCCGMAGTWGHEAEHRATSEHIYSLSWARTRGGSRDFRDATRRRLLVPVPGETDRQCKAGASRAGPLGRNPGLEQWGRVPREHSSQRQNHRPPPFQFAGSIM